MLGNRDYEPKEELLARNRSEGIMLLGVIMAVRSIGSR